MKDYQVKSFNFEVKATSDNTFEGYASVFDNIDSDRDVVEKGAFSKTIQESKRVKILWQHDPWQPIGKPLTMSEDSKGLHVKGKISETELGKNALILMKDGVIDELSIGFNTVKDEWDSKAQVRRIKEVKLWEFSLVTFAANEMATITGVKNNQGLEGLLFNLNNELKAGKVLSDKNATVVKNAIEALQALLNASEGKNVEPPGAGTQLSEDEEKAAKDIMAIMANMKNLNWGGKH